MCPVELKNVVLEMFGFALSLLIYNEIYCKGFVITDSFPISVVGDQFSLYLY